MSDLESEITRLLGQASQGEEAAIAELLGRYEAEIRLVARRQLGHSLRPYLDSMDLAQSISEDLIVGLRAGKFDFDDPRQLLAFVAGLVRWKTARHWRKHRRQQRQSGFHPPADSLADVIVSLQAPENPEIDVADRDQVEFLLSQLESSDRELIALRLEGYSTVEVARLLNANPDVTRVRLSRLRKRLQNAKWLANLL